MSAEVRFTFQTEATGNAFSVPISALKPSTKDNNALVYVYDKNESVVRERAVRVVGVDGNEPQISANSELATSSLQPVWGTCTTA